MAHRFWDATHTLHKVWQATGRCRVSVLSEEDWDVLREYEFPVEQVQEQATPTIDEYSNEDIEVTSEIADLKAAVTQQV